MRTRSLRRPALFPALLLALAIGGSHGCFTLVPIRGYAFDTTAGGGLGDCPDLAGTFKVTGQAGDYVVFFIILPIWWERDPPQPRLDKDLGLVRHNGKPIEIQGAEYVTISQPDPDHIVITVLDGSGRAMENWEGIAFAHREGVVSRVSDSGFAFRCYPSRNREARLLISWDFKHGDGFADEYRRWIGRRADGSGGLLLDTSSRGLGADLETGWHWYENVPSGEPWP